jgi:PAS domain S-box-containing protein
MRKVSSRKPIRRWGSKDSPVAHPAAEPVKAYGSPGDYLRAIINSLKDELMVIDRDYCIIEANEVLLSRHGKCREEVIGEYCYHISYGRHKPCRLPHHECPIKTVYETSKPLRVTHTHIYNIKGEKEKKYLDIIASPITDSQGNVTAVTELMRDVTEAKELELKIAEAHQNLLALNTIATVVSQSLDLDTILSSALDKTLEIMKGNIGGILLLDEEKRMLCYRVQRGLSTRFVGEMCLSLGEGIAGRVAQTGEPMLLEDISIDPRAARADLINTEGLRAFASVPLRSKEKVLGVLNITSHEARKFSAEDVQLLDSIASQIAIAVENAKLHQEVQRKDESRGELLGEIFSIQEEERRRIARELHDETSQSLASLAASLKAVVGILPAGADEATARLRKLEQVAINVLDEIHKLIYELRPTLLDDLGLVSATRWLVDNNLRAAGVTVNFKAAGRVRRLLPRLETTLFRVIQEVVYNIARHAHAKNVDVELRFKKRAIVAHVRDDGEGFDVEEAISSKDRPRGLGLLGMKERVELIGGTLSIRSSPASGGTEIDVEIPLSYEVSNG